MFTALDTNLCYAYHNQLPFKMTITTYSYATNDLLPPFGRIHISPPNSPISQCTNYKKKENTQALLSISLKAIASLLAVWYASNCGEQRGKKRPRDDKENRSTSFSRGMYFLNANMNKTFGEKNRRNALSSWRKNLSKQRIQNDRLWEHQATFNWIKFSHDLGELLIFSDLKA